MVNGFSEKVDFIWSIADLLRGDYKQSEYQKVILPLGLLWLFVAHSCLTADNFDWTFLGIVDSSVSCVDRSKVKC